MLCRIRSHWKSSLFLVTLLLCILPVFSSVSASGVSSEIRSEKLDGSNVNWAVLLDALEKHESGLLNLDKPCYGELLAINPGDGGKSHGVLQIGKLARRDVESVYGVSYDQADMHDRVKARHCAVLYLKHWGGKYRERTGLSPTYEVYVRIFNGGPRGWEKPETLCYYRKVRSFI